MRIVIAGAGAVGTHLAKLLSQENQDVILMDPDKENLNFSRNNLEMITMVGSPTSLKDLNEVGIKEADFFIGVTPEESLNITSCMLAARLGAKKTFARIDNYEYLLPKNKDFFESLGINAMVYPEMLAAKEIVSAIKRPWARFWIELCGGAIILVGVKVRSNSELVGKHLYELGSDRKKFHIVAIKRESTTIIPNGNHQILDNDLVFFSTTNEFVSELPDLTGKEDFDVKDVMIMGGSRIAVRTSQYLSEKTNIKLLESDRDKCHLLLERVPKNVTVFNDDGRNTDFLLQEGIRDTDAFIAVTGNSEANILACLAAKRFGVRKTVAEVENMDYVSMAESLGIGTIINKKLITVNNIYRFLLNADISTVKSLAFANADVAEIIAHPNSRITKKEIKRMVFPKNVTLGGLIRNGDPMMIDGDTQVEPYDHVVVFCLEDSLRDIENFFN
ncbi:trk system potassium uptake protein TrkA [Dysgonomonas sp. PH5-45]|uniref:Trk system potassium transporter TrkA n=1 Tax=unclassified Dysgonomonas TaxID=2630389 RepID=UPI0024747737|nr:MULTISPECIES: Trk system potassium transporter TrkA [unclassified Dysgonomonas]MDH6353810.1 trk system potassium uptake protein TrkA [Dysgonomonas sp. PH5-45]MDH6386712.1 trk system potassium uptake protein TrkA [Dysgonomonas sp. PH5-37]